jgi:hypothetical protein
MTDQITPQPFHNAEGIADWRVVGDPSMPSRPSRKPSWGKLGHRQMVRRFRRNCRRQDVANRVGRRPPGREASAPPLQPLAVDRAGLPHAGLRQDAPGEPGIGVESRGYGLAQPVVGAARVADGGESLGRGTARPASQPAWMPERPAGIRRVRVDGRARSRRTPDRGRVDGQALSTSACAARISSGKLTLGIAQPGAIRSFCGPASAMAARTCSRMAAADISANFT